MNNTCVSRVIGKYCRHSFHSVTIGVFNENTTNLLFTCRKRVDK